MVITEANDAYKGGLVDDRTMYIPADQLENGDWAGTLVHEFTHFEEGSKEYALMADFLQSDDILVDDGEGGKISLLDKAEAAVLAEEWVKKADELSVKCKEVITKTLKDNGYDGVILKRDEGSGGRTVETYIALDPEQVKSATDNIGTFDRTKKTSDSTARKRRTTLAISLPTRTTAGLFTRYLAVRSER